MWKPVTHLRNVILLCLLTCSLAFAQERERAGVAIDMTTTAIGITSGIAVEGNPLALPLLPLRLHIIDEASKLPDGQRQEALDQINALNTGVITSNLIVLLFHAVVPVAGVIAGILTYQMGEKKREFMSACQYRKEIFPDETNLVCKQ